MGTATAMYTGTDTDTDTGAGTPMAADLGTWLRMRVVRRLVVSRLWCLCLDQVVLGRRVVVLVVLATTHPLVGGARSGRGCLRTKGWG